MSLKDSPDNAYSAIGLLCMRAIESYKLERFGEYLAETHSYKHHSGLDAIRYHLLQTGKVSAVEARSLSAEDLSFCVGEELEEWNLPSGERGVSNKFFAAVAQLSATPGAGHQSSKKSPKS